MKETKRERIRHAFGGGGQGRGLLWFPAGMELELDLQIGVRYRGPSDRTEPLQLRYRRIERDTHVYRIHDREITLRTRAQRSCLQESDFDELVSLSPWTAGSAMNNELDLVMCSAGTDMTGRHPQARDSGLVALNDSGGFQLKIGKADVIDLDLLIEWMNATADFGFVLDTPPRAVIDWGNRDVTMALAETQRRVCERMQAEKADDLQLLNIAHGATLDLVRGWIDTVGMEGYAGWGAAHDNDKDRASAFRTALILIQEFDVKWVHILGVSGVSYMPIMAWLGRAARITCDSTTHLQGMMQRKYFVQDAKGRLRQDIQLGNYADRDELGLETTLPCGCPVCQTMKYTDMLSHNTMDDDGSNGSLGKLLTIHNLFAIRAYAHGWSSLALHPEMTINIFRQAVLDTVGEKAAALLDYVDRGMTKGVDAAEDRAPQSLFPSPTGAYTKNGFAEGTNLALLRHYLMPRHPEALAQLAPSVQQWLHEHD